MKLYNTLTKQVETVVPQQAGRVTVYTCGPTVYDYSHIGHWFTYVRADMLIRTLQLAGLVPQWVMNITDVGHLVSDADDGEDKLEKGARREGKTAWEVAEFYTRDFLEGMQLLRITAPDVMPKATDHIAEQIVLIKKLEAQDCTYVIDDGVYYDTARFPRYADFAQLNLSEQAGSGRVAANPQKRQAADFALWKFTPAGQRRDMEWDSPWGKGFPGWHIECSAMSMKYLGETLDLHTGGIDHVPVHHTNEIAQSEAATGQRFVNHWLHSNHVLVEGEKISKSLGNGIRLSEIIARGIAPEAIRLYILESHYRTQAHFSWGGLKAAQQRLQGYWAMADLYWQPVSAGGMGAEEVRGYSEMITNVLRNDLDTPTALVCVNALQGGLDKGGISTACQEAYGEVLDQLEQALGLWLKGDDITAEQKQLINSREAARAAQNWEKSDELRDKLTQQGIAVKDTERGTIWARRRGL